MGETFFAVGRPGYYLLILVFLGCIAAVLYLNRRRTRTATRAEQLQKTYAVMTPALLEKTPDEEVVSAVIANLMAKLREHNPDPLITMPQQSIGRSAVYFCWLLCKEAEKNGVAALLQKPSVRFADIGEESFKIVGAIATSDAFAAYRETPSEETAAALESALQTERPLTLCVAYIRSLPEEFTDESKVSA